jgi:hypothetical protein
MHLIYITNIRESSPLLECLVEKADFTIEEAFQYAKQLSELYKQYAFDTTTGEIVAAVNNDGQLIVSKNIKIKARPGFKKDASK